MTFVPFSLLKDQLEKEISINPEKTDKELFKKPILTDPVLATSTFGKYADLPLTTLSDVYDDSTNKETIFKTRFYVIKVTPDNVEDYVENYVPKDSNG
jgi:hypothetical protein